MKRSDSREKLGFFVGLVREKEDESFEIDVQRSFEKLMRGTAAMRTITNPAHPA